MKARDDFLRELDLGVARIAPFRALALQARDAPPSGRNDSSSK